MKIIPGNMFNTGRDVMRKQSQSEAAAPKDAAAKTAGRDKIIIESTQNPGLSDAQLIAQLKKSILSEIQAGAPEYKLTDLKQQVALDKYDINISEIIRKLLLDNPEVNYE